MKAFLSFGQEDFRVLVAHSHACQADEPLEAVHRRFSELQREYLAVLDGSRLLGLCARQRIGMALGARYGFAMYARKPVRDFLLPAHTSICTRDSLADALRKVFTRPDDIGFDDVLLVDEGGSYVGNIDVRTLVRLQHGMFQKNIRELERQRTELNRKNEEMKHDLQLAGEVQLALLPQQYPQFFAGGKPCLRFHHHFVPSGLVGGDLFHVFPLDSRTVGLFICDVMGHGVRSAFITAMLRTLVQELGHLGREPGELLARVNSSLKSILKPTGELIYATGFYLVADVASGRIQYAQASHASPLLLCRGGDRPVEPLASQPRGSGAALGLFERTRYTTFDGSLLPGDMLFFFTDGLTEIFDTEGNEFGGRQLACAIERRRRLPLDAILDGVMEEALGFSACHRLEDDLCFVGMETLQLAPPDAPQTLPSDHGLRSVPV
jgi:serine phosphatase RsbU (regulator of sigma subunit)